MLLTNSELAEFIWPWQPFLTRSRLSANVPSKHTLDSRDKSEHMTIGQDARVKFELAPAFHFTLIENLSSILTEGCLISKALLGGRLVGDLSDLQIQRARKLRPVLDTGRNLHEFVPLYFAFKTPMLSLRRDRNEDIIYLRFPLDVLGLPGAIFSDGNARDEKTRFFPFGSVDDLAVLDVRAINSVKWGQDDEKKRRKQAEILIPARLDVTYLIDILCFSNSARHRVENVLQTFGVTMRVLVKPGFYFSENQT